MAAFIFFYVMIVAITLFVIFTVQTLKGIMSERGLVLDLKKLRFVPWWSIDSDSLNKLARLLWQVYYVLHILNRFLLPPALAFCFKNGGKLRTAMQWLMVVLALVWAILDAIIRFLTWP
jgi:hypothetical protein